MEEKHEHRGGAIKENSGEECHTVWDWGPMATEASHLLGNMDSV